jgi:hypothetical protein
MSSTNAEDSTDPEHDLTPAEIASRRRLEAVAQQGLGSYVEVENALAEIRDPDLYRESLSSFETYVGERWGINIPNADPPS